MSDESNIFGTPITAKRRCLGLRRPHNIHTTPGQRVVVRKDLWTDSKATIDAERPSNVDNSNTPCSSGSLRIVQTPIAGSLPCKTASTIGCRPYRLSLNRNLRKSFTKKRLEFQLANEHLEEVKSGNDDDQKLTSAVENRPTCSLESEKLDEQSVAHRKKVNELKAIIDTWKEGFLAAMTELQSSSEPRLEFSALLANLNIPPNMIKYLEEDC